MLGVRSLAREGFWADDSAPTNPFFPCGRDPKFGSQCLAGTWNASTSKPTIVACNPVKQRHTCVALRCRTISSVANLQRYTGRLCKQCADGYYPFFGSCESCEYDRGTTRSAAVRIEYAQLLWNTAGPNAPNIGSFIINGLLIVWATWLVVNRFSGRLRFPARSPSASVVWSVNVARVLCEYLTMCDILLSFAQIAGTIGGFSVPWPGEPQSDPPSSITFVV